MSTWIIETWMGGRAFPGETFESYEEARGRIMEYADNAAETEDDYDGICEDLYAVEVLA